MRCRKTFEYSLSHAHRAELKGSGKFVVFVSFHFFTFMFTPLHIFSQALDLYEILAVFRKFILMYACETMNFLRKPFKFYFYF